MTITLMHWPPRRRSNRTGSRTAPKPYLSDSHWLLIVDALADPPPSAKGGRPRVPPRPCLEGVLWVLVNGARWQAPIAPRKGPMQYPSPSTCWRRLRDWTHEGRFVQAWRRLLEKMDRLRGINWEEAMADGSFSRAKSLACRRARRTRAQRLATAVRATARPSC